MSTLTKGRANSVLITRKDIVQDIPEIPIELICARNEAARVQPKWDSLSEFEVDAFIRGFNYCFKLLNQESESEDNV